MDEISPFCPICGEHRPYHHSGVKHDWKSSEMEQYFKEMRPFFKLHPNIDFSIEKLKENAILFGG